MMRASRSTREPRATIPGATCAVNAPATLATPDFAHGANRSPAADDDKDLQTRRLAGGKTQFAIAFGTIRLTAVVAPM